MQADVKNKDHRTHSTRKNVRWSNDLLALIDEARGDESFSSYVQKACKEKLSKANLLIEKSEE